MAVLGALTEPPQGEEANGSQAVIPESARKRRAMSPRPSIQTTASPGNCRWRNVWSSDRNGSGSADRRALPSAA
ncbi:hypothetical protein CBM2598_U10312 [Cupriavidus taiwanensis]|nr:hypothetical protein CBM2598_U10312 [Cupriavidus taiwanensis]